MDTGFTEDENNIMTLSENREKRFKDTRRLCENFRCLFLRFVCVSVCLCCMCMRACINMRTFEFRFMYVRIMYVCEYRFVYPRREFYFRAAQRFIFLLDHTIS